MTHLYLKRYSFGNDSTLGLLFVKDQFECFTLEDEVRDEKKYGETAIWEGTYEIGLRTEGGFHNRYSKRYGSDFHKGMLEIKDVPEFEYILFHPGNTDEHTNGCVLLGEAIEMEDGEGKIPPGKTVGAYKRFYPKVRDELLNGERVLLHVERLTI